MSKPSANDREVEFKILKEDWNKYKLDDGTTLRARIILGKVFEGTNENEFAFEFVPPFFSITAPKEKMGEQNNEPKPDELDSSPNEIINFEVLKEPWNNYLTESPKPKTISIKYSISFLKRLVDRYDKNGNPFYVVSGGPAITVT